VGRFSRGPRFPLAIFSCAVALVLRARTEGSSGLYARRSQEADRLLQEGEPLRARAHNSHRREIKMRGPLAPPDGLLVFRRGFKAAPIIRAGGRPWRLRARAPSMAARGRSLRSPLGVLGCCGMMVTVVLIGKLLEIWGRIPV
jgi:hypothetical protein